MIAGIFIGLGIAAFIVIATFIYVAANWWGR